MRNVVFVRDILSGHTPEGRKKNFHVSRSASFFLVALLVLLPLRHALGEEGAPAPEANIEAAPAEAIAPVEENEPIVVPEGSDQAIEAPAEDPLAPSPEENIAEEETAPVAVEGEGAPEPEAEPETSEVVDDKAALFSPEAASEALPESDNTESDTSDSENEIEGAEEYVENEAKNVEEDGLSENEPSDSGDVPVEEESPTPETQHEDSGAAKDLRPEELEAALRAQLWGNAQLFFEKRCVRQGDGFYCSDEAAGDGGSKSAPSPEGFRVFSEKEQGGGDGEIYIEEAGVRVRVTENDWEDAFPAGEPSGRYVAWQGMEGDLWQIFLYDRASGKTERMTDGVGNAMNPKLSNNVLVWQGWAGGNWDIFIAEKRGEASSSVWASRRLTENSRHDMFPQISGGVVAWQTLREGSWRVVLYDLASGKESELVPESGRYENPRFVLLLDERDPGGRARLVAYDPASGREEVLSLPSPVPVPDASSVPSSEEEHKAMPVASSSAKEADAEDGSEE